MQGKWANAVKPATDPLQDYKALVRRGYDLCSGRFVAARRLEPPESLGVLTERLWEGARVLDLGCGGGVPIAKSMSEQFEVTGVDFSSEQIRRARENVPTATFHCCDVLDYIPEHPFDGVTAFYLLFHLPRADQLELIRRLSTWVKPGGLVLATITESEEAPYTEDDFFGTTMYWTNFSRSKYEAVFQDAGFRVLSVGVVGHGYRDGERSEHHPLLLAERVHWLHR